jgi:hypothetical protein
MGSDFYCHSFLDDEGNTQNYIPVYKTNLENIFDLVPR